MVCCSPLFEQSIGAMAVVTTILLNLSGVSGLWFHYGLIIDNLAVSVRNFSGVVLFILYCFYYIYFSDEKTLPTLHFLNTCILTMVIVIYIDTSVEDPAKMEGYVATVFNLLFRASPLMSIKKVIETESTELLPFPMIFLGFVTSALAFFHGIIINDAFIIFNGAVTGVISTGQLMLFIIYPSHKKES